METPDRIKKSLRIHSLNHPSGCIGCAYRGDNASKIPNGCADKLFKDVREYIKQLEAQVPRWISVEERLPENYISVIGYLPIDDKEGLPPTREVYRTEKGWFAPSLGELCTVTHWMSMPEGFREV